MMKKMWKTQNICAPTIIVFPEIDSEAGGSDLAGDGVHRDHHRDVSLHPPGADHLGDSGDHPRGGRHLR